MKSPYESTYERWERERRERRQRLGLLLDGLLAVAFIVGLYLLFTAILRWGA
jgi:hypothetical protein